MLHLKQPITLVTPRAAPCSWRAEALIRGVVTTLALAPIGFNNGLGSDDILVDSPLARRPLKYLVRCTGEISRDSLPQHVCLRIHADRRSPRCQFRNFF